MIPQEAIEAAREALLGYTGGCTCHEAYTLRNMEDPDCTYHDVQINEAAAEVLKAAAPFIRAQALEDAADELATRSEIFLKTMQNMSEMIGTYTHDDIVRCGAYSAEANTTSTRLRARAATERGQG